jgi:L-fuculose-phosphate aldolase
MITVKEYEQLTKRILNACKRLYRRGILSGVGGNISVRTSMPSVILCSPSGVPIMDMLLEDICIVDISDIGKDKYQVLKGEHNPTSEILLHGGIYDMRPEIKAVLHTHPPITTAFSCTSQEINYKIQEDQRWYIGDIASLPFVYSSSKALAEAALPKLKKNYALILKNHGIFALGDSLLEAVTITELMEDLSKIYYHAMMIGKGKVVELPKAYWTEVTIETRKNLIYHDEVFDQ